MKRPRRPPRTKPPPPASPLSTFVLKRVPLHYDFLTTDYTLALATDVVQGHWVALRYAGPRLRVEISYDGQREFYFNITVARIDPGDPSPVDYGLWEWLAALGARPGAAGAANVWPESAIDQYAQRAAETLRHALPRILTAGPDVLQAMARRRAVAAACPH